MRALVYTSLGVGHLFPYVPVALELKRRGHGVSFRTFASHVPMVRTLGLDAEALDPRIEALTQDDWQGRNPLDSLSRGLRRFATRAPHEAVDLQRAIQAERPDVLVVDANCWGAMSAAEGAGVPWAAAAPFLLPVPSRDLPPYGPGLQPRSGWVGAIRDALVRAIWRRGLGQALPAINQVRRDVGVPPLRLLEELANGPQRVLSFTAEPFEYPRSDWPPAVRLVGPCAWEPDSAPPDWLASESRPLVLVATSSEFQNDGVLIATAFEALAGEEVRVVATAPSVDASGIRVPANASIERFTGHAPLLARAACVVCHGGMGVTQKALASEVPVVVVPFGRDQHEVAARVERAGVGVRLPAHRLAPSRLREAVAVARARKAATARVAEGFRKAGNGRAAADVIEALAVC